MGKVVDWEFIGDDCLYVDYTDGESLVPLHDRHPLAFSDLEGMTRDQVEALIAPYLDVLD